MQNEVSDALWPHPAFSVGCTPSEQERSRTPCSRTTCSPGERRRRTGSVDLSVLQNREKGEIIQLNSENLVGVSGNVLLIGDVLPENGPGFTSKNLPLVDGDELLKGDVLSVNDSYFMFLNDEV